jgi:hypothetical protein
MPKLTIAQYLKQQQKTVVLNYRCSTKNLTQQQKNHIVQNHFLSDYRLSVITRTYNYSLIQACKKQYYLLNPHLQPVGYFSKKGLKMYKISRLKNIKLSNLEQSLYQIIFEHSHQDKLNSRIKRDLKIVFEYLSKNYFLKKGKIHHKNGKNTSQKGEDNKTEALF